MTGSTMLLPADQRRMLGAFLRARREALVPARVDGAALFPGRRRTPGLRREEVAQLCGISTTWYSWVEQGRDVSLSAASLARLSDALRLTAAERTYLFELSQRRDPAPHPAAGSDRFVAPELIAVLETAAAPAYLIDRRWSALAWNAAASHLFAPWVESREPCLLRYVFLDPGARAFICDWEDRARRIIAEFRADTARSPGDVGLNTLIEGLLGDSPDFARLWNSHTVLSREGGRRRFRHPQDGVLCFEQITLIPVSHPEHRIVMLLPCSHGAEP